jgi:hypothetical protein
MHRTRNAAYGQPYRGFESLPLRQNSNKPLKYNHFSMRWLHTHVSTYARIRAYSSEIGSVAAYYRSGGRGVDPMSRMSVWGGTLWNRNANLLAFYDLLASHPNSQLH